MYVVWCVVSDLHDNLIARSEGVLLDVCVSNCMWSGNPNSEKAETRIWLLRRRKKYECKQFICWLSVNKKYLHVYVLIGILRRRSTAFISVAFFCVIQRYVRTQTQLPQRSAHLPVSFHTISVFSNTNVSHITQICRSHLMTPRCAFLLHPQPLGTWTLSFACGYRQLC